MVHGLWAGSIDKDGFLNNMESVIDRGLRKAWNEGLSDVGLLPEDMTSEEELRIGQIVLEQYNYTGDFADYIIDHNKASGAKLASLQFRTSMWINQYNSVRNQAKMSATADAPMTWEFGGTLEHCDDCAYARGRTYRASVWQRWGWVPQSHDLQCGGYNCLCYLSPADPNFTKLTPGHPRRPVGP